MGCPVSSQGDAQVVWSRTGVTVYGDQDRLFTYWDYRRGDFHEHRGMRIDLALATKPVAERIRWAIVDRNARKGKLPSDHAPLVIDLDD